MSAHRADLTCRCRDVEPFIVSPGGFFPAPPRQENAMPSNQPAVTEPRVNDAEFTSEERFENAARILASGIRRVMVRRKHGEGAAETASTPALPTDAPTGEEDLMP